MSTIGVHADLEGSQKKWIFGALAIAFLAHVLFFWALGWYKIPGMEIPNSFTPPTGPFTVKQIEINPDAYKSQMDDPISRLPVAEPPKNPSDFNLDPNVIEKALQTPQPALATPAVPEPNKVIASTDLSQRMPYVESDKAKVSAEIAQVDPAMGSGPSASSKLAQELISATTGPAQPGVAAGAPATGNGAGKLPGFADLAPGFKSSTVNMNNLPEPVLLRLPSDVLFDFDSATLKSEADPLLTKAIGLITKYPQADVQIDGYSDSFGRADYNLTLSQQRAEAVQAWLKAKIEGGYKFHALGHGSANYVISAQATVEQQQPNRRVEILIQALKP